MSVTFGINVGFSLGGKTFSQQKSISGKNLELADPPALAAAKDGVLTVRTDADTGSLTMESGHGITDGQQLDLFWDGGSRRCVVGTVASLVVPIDNGFGDDLPTAATAITAQVPTEVDFEVVGDDVQAFAASSQGRGRVTFVDGSDGEIFTLDLEAGGAYGWHDGAPIANPLAGETVAKVLFANGDSAGSKSMKAGALI